MPSIRDAIVEIIMTACKPHVPDLSDENKLLLQLGLDSLDFASVLMAIEDEFGVTIQESDMESLGTITSLVAYIEGTAKATKSA